MCVPHPLPPCGMRGGYNIASCDWVNFEASVMPDVAGCAICCNYYGALENWEIPRCPTACYHESLASLSPSTAL